MAESNGQSAWVNWSETMMREHVPILHSMMEELNRLPRWPHTIVKNDVERLYTITTALNVNFDGYNLWDREDFIHILGLCKRKITEFVQKDLRPTDPILDKLEKLNIEKDEVDDIMEVELGEL